MIVICNRHDKIINLATQMERLDQRNFDNVQEVLDEVWSMAWDIRKEAEKAKESGQNMEDRLTEYRESMESLGFIRYSTNTQ